MITPLRPCLNMLQIICGPHPLRSYRLQIGGALDICPATMWISGMRDCIADSKRMAGAPEPHRRELEGAAEPHQSFPRPQRCGFVCCYASGYTTEQHSRPVQLLCEKRRGPAARAPFWLEPSLGAGAGFWNLTLHDRRFQCALVTSPVDATSSCRLNAVWLLCWHLHY